MHWFIADTHFNHANIIDYCRRPFASAEEMDETLIYNWNSVVGKDDIVFHLGDFMFGDRQIIKNMCDRLNGRKSLIMGNHDRHKVGFFLDVGFAYVYKTPVKFGKNYLLSHRPQCLNTHKRFINIHGHTHNNYDLPVCRDNGVCVFYNVSVEMHNYLPVAFEDIKKQCMKELQTVSG